MPADVDPPAPSPPPPPARPLLPEALGSSHSTSPATSLLQPLLDHLCLPLTFSTCLCWWGASHSPSHISLPGTPPLQAVSPPALFPPPTVPVLSPTCALSCSLPDAPRLADRRLLLPRTIFSESILCAILLPTPRHASCGALPTGCPLTLRLPRGFSPSRSPSRRIATWAGPRGSLAGPGETPGSTPPPRPAPICNASAIWPPFFSPLHSGPGPVLAFLVVFVLVGMASSAYPHIRASETGAKAWRDPW